MNKHSPLSGTVLFPFLCILRGMVFFKTQGSPGPLSGTVLWGGTVLFFWGGDSRVKYTIRYDLLLSYCGPTGTKAKLAGWITWGKYSKRGHCF